MVESLKVVLDSKEERRTVSFSHLYLGSWITTTINASETRIQIPEKLKLEDVNGITDFASFVCNRVNEVRDKLRFNPVQESKTKITGYEFWLNDNFISLKLKRSYASNYEIVIEQGDRELVISSVQPNVVFDKDLVELFDPFFQSIYDYLRQNKLIENEEED